MPGRRCDLDVFQLRQMVADGATQNDIAVWFQCSTGTVRNWLRERGLTAKARTQEPKPDPTPEEIAERAAEIRERHLVALRRETPEETDRRLGVACDFAG